MSPIFRSNGTRDARRRRNMRGTSPSNFANWRLTVDGLVARPLSIPLQTLRVDAASHPDHPPRLRRGLERDRQVARRAAVAHPRRTPGLSTRAKYIVFHCADRFGDKPYYESIDLVDAFHPQTIIAWGMNGHLLPVPNGAPLRLRVERQLGYKQAKYVQRIEAVDSLAGVYGGKGGYWEDNVDYEWYAGI